MFNMTTASLDFGLNFHIFPQPMTDRMMPYGTGGYMLTCFQLFDATTLRTEAVITGFCTLAA
jgi:hypothetical protein